MSNYSPTATPGGSNYGRPPAQPQQPTPTPAPTTGPYVSDQQTHYHLQSQLPYVSEATAPPNIMAAFNLLPLHRHSIELAANADGQFPGLMTLLASFFTDKTRELSTLEWATIAMRSSVLYKSPYVFDTNRKVAIANNMPPEKILLIQFGDFSDDNYWTARERLLMRYVEALIQTHTVTDELLEELKKGLTAREIVEVVDMVGVYNIFSHVGNVARIDFDKDAPNAGAILGGLTGVANAIQQGSGN